MPCFLPSASRPSISDIDPATCTQTIAFVFRVIAASACLISIVPVNGSTSTIFGIALTVKIVLIVAKKDQSATITSSRSPIPNARKITSRVWVPLVTAKEASEFVYSLHSFSNSLTSLP